MGLLQRQVSKYTHFLASTSQGQDIWARGAYFIFNKLINMNNGSTILQMMYNKYEAILLNKQFAISLEIKT
jgi:hypothetical protein